jgi:hypothetical protein
VGWLVREDLRRTTGYIFGYVAATLQGNVLDTGLRALNKVACDDDGAISNRVTRIVGAVGVAVIRVGSARAETLACILVACTVLGRTDG